jgi:glycerol-3-phosphate O-acyltransferase/dihydroxyacetone phosphate acyltransferase
MNAPVSPLVRWVAAVAAIIFYRIDCVGAPPAEGPVLLLPNHPNALLDPAVIWHTAGRDVRFLAKSTLFRGPLGALLRGGGAIPVYRRTDAGSDVAHVARNAGMFAAVGQALAGGDAVCIFPEGISHSSGRLEPLRTGAARIALAAERAGTRVAMVAVGLNFDRKARFRSRVTVAYGSPFFSADIDTDDARTPRAGSPESEAAGVQRLTERIALHMRRLMIEADPTGDAALVDRVDRLYTAARWLQSEAAERLERRQIIAGGIERLRAEDPVRYADTLLRVRRYDERLRRFGLRESQLDRPPSSADVLTFTCRELLAAVVLIPLSIAGLVTFALPYWVTAWLAHRWIHDDDVRATAKVVGGAIVYGSWMCLLAVVAWLEAGLGWAFAVFIAVPVLALLSLLAIERETAVAEAVRAWLLLRRTRRATIAQLHKRRSELADLLDDVRNWLAEAERAR